MKYRYMGFFHLITKSNLSSTINIIVIISMFFSPLLPLVNASANNPNQLDSAELVESGESEETTPIPEGNQQDETPTPPSIVDAPQQEPTQNIPAENGQSAGHYIYIPFFTNEAGKPPIYGADLSLQKSREPNPPVDPG